jgi:two-component system, NtrC family, response regulator AtoC
MEPYPTQYPPREDLPPRVLVAEDDAEMLKLVQHVLAEESYRVIPARDGTEALAVLETGEFDIVLTDIRMPGTDGLEVFRRAMAKNLHQPVILMTAFGSIEAGVRAMREGAYHYLAKPFNIEDLLEVIGGAAEKIRQLRAMGQGAAPELAELPAIVYRSPVMCDLLQMTRDIATSNASVLITGSSGTGKEILARLIHRLSLRNTRPFVAVDCNAIPETLLESELFGHRRGTFTGAVADKAGIIERAHGGTLFLDEIGNLSPSIQAKLLRFLQDRRFRRVGETEERAVNIRLITASNRDLQQEVEKQTFRDDLFYRLSVIHLKIPDLKERREDIMPLVYHFIRKFNTGYQVEGVRQDAMELLVSYPWPGNVRQVENVVERAVILRKAGLIQPRDLPEEIVRGEGLSACSLEEMERRYILRLLQECRGNQSRVARILGINRRTLYRKLRKFGCEAEEPV